MTLSGPTDENNFVYDFSDLKNLVKKTLKETLDHALIVPETFKPSIEGWWYFPNSWSYLAPKGSVFAIPTKANDVVREDVQKACEEILSNKLGENFQLEVNLSDETDSEGYSYYCYTHGITGHAGACQRTFHGHRSKLIAKINGERKPQLEQRIVNEIFEKSIHIASKNQILEETEDTYYLAYEGSYGTFKATIPKNRSIIIHQETSIEAITYNIAKLTKKFIQSDDELEISCFEGIDKGATVKL